MIKNALRSKIINDAAVSVIIENKVYPLHLPQGGELPCVLYQSKGTKPLTLMTNDPGYSQASFDIAAYAKDYDTCVDLATKVKAALERWKGVEAGVTVLECMIDVADTEDYEPDLELYESQMTITVHYQE